MNYKSIIIKENIETQKEVLKIVTDFNLYFSENEVRLKLTDNNLTLLLKEIDINKLKEYAVSFENEEDTNQLLKTVINKTESIKSYGLNSGKRNYVDYNKERKVTNRKDKEIKRGIYYYAQDNNFSEKNNELPKKHENKIICGDSLKILKKIPDNCIDLVFTSPPYNFGLEYSDNEDDRKWENYFEHLFAIFDETIRVLKYGGRIIVNLQPLFSDYIPSHHIISNYFLNRKMIWKGEILWEKNNYNCKYTAWGSWKSPSSPYLKYTWEFLEIFSKGDLKHPGKKEDIDITAEEFKKFVVAKWSIAPERKMKEYGHPAMFPEKLVERALKLFSFKNDIILDPFNGVGTTTAVAKRLNRRYLGIDISEKYCEVANKRLS
ncbi:MAG: site-specific DNA-methyltransferase [Bacteroidales bacterium]|nr:site-specific DNA-methyltransferase [Bacteroidales bacterium]